MATFYHLQYAGQRYSISDDAGEPLKTQIYAALRNGGGWVDVEAGKGIISILVSAGVEIVVEREDRAGISDAPLLAPVVVARSDD